MRLTKQIKDSIDHYFDKISAEELYQALTGNYGMSDIFNEFSADYGSLIDDYQISPDDLFEEIQKMSFDSIATGITTDSRQDSSVDANNQPQLAEAA